MRKKLSGALFWSVLSLIYTPVAGNSQSATPDGRRISIHVYNYATVPSGVLERAKAEAARAFRRVGIGVELADCPLSEAELGKYPACKEKRPSSLLVVKLIPREMATDWPASRLELGAALPGSTQELASHAYVFFHRVRQRAAIKNCDIAILLGYAMAHEVGHLLLGFGGHSSRGIMRPEWSTQDLKRAQKGELNFTRAQVDRMKTQIARRKTLVRL